MIVAGLPVVFFIMFGIPVIANWSERDVGHRLMALGLASLSAVLLLWALQSTGSLPALSQPRSLP